MTRPGNPAVLTIEKLAPGGDGVAHVDGNSCFVPFTAPGDRVLADIVKSNRRFSRGVLVEVLKDGPGRREPCCPHFGICGGCLWQHLSYEVQLEAKRRILARALNLEFVDIIPSPNEIEYRSVARLHVKPGKGDAPPLMGFAHVNRRTIVPVSHCPVLARPLSDCLPRLQSELVPHIRARCDIRLGLGDDERPLVSITADTALPAAFYEAAARLVPKPFLGVHLDALGVCTTVAGAGYVERRGVDDRPMAVPAGSFGQANQPINFRIAETVRSWIVGSGCQSVLELFAGAGNLTVGYADAVSRVTASDIDSAAAGLAKRNFESRGLSHITAVPGDALEIYRSLGRDADLILLDPPRDGHRELARNIAASDHRAVVYVSCNPSTLLRDLAELKASGYNSSAAMGFDMFPQTPHMEAAVLMER